MVLSLRALLHGAVATYFVIRNLRRHRHHAPASPDLVCNIALPLRWEARNGELLVHDQVFHLKGVNWYGAETEAGAVQGLDKRTMDDIFAFLQEKNFNALRLPFSLRFSLTYDSPVPGSETFLDADLHGMTKGELFRRIVEKAGEHKMVVLLDMHRLNEVVIPQLWYDEQNSMADVLRGWYVVMNDLQGHWNVLGCDLKNEPSGIASWGDKSPATDWNSAAEEIGKHILGTFRDWQGLIFVEGIAWSRDFRGFVEDPIDFGDPDWNQRMVLSPHVYGPSVSNNTLFSAVDFPANMPAEWTARWGFLRDAGKTVVLGEWGGRYLDRDKIWQDAFAEYLLTNCFSNTFTWDLNPDSDDTGGLLRADWLSPELEKLAVLARVQPTPSFLSRNNPAAEQVCLTTGAFANPTCATPPVATRLRS